MTNNSQQLVKRFVAPTMTRALELVQQELGPEAVILSSRRVDKGIEIVTSLEPDLPTRGIDVRRNFGQNFDAELDRALPSDSAWRSQAGIEQAAASYGGRSESNSRNLRQKSPSELAEEIERAREKMLHAKKRAQSDGENTFSSSNNSAQTSRNNNTKRFDSYSDTRSEDYSQHESRSSSRDSKLSDDRYHQTHAGHSVSENVEHQIENDAHLEQLQNEIADMRLLLEQQLWKMNESRAPVTNIAMPQQIDMPNNHPLLRDRLERLGLRSTLSESLLTQVDQCSRSSIAWRDCIASLSKQIPICSRPILDHPGIYAFLGQTGVGKTTSIAKLAAQYVLEHGPGKVALVTTDTFRVGAFDQLRTMGRILNVPVRIVDSENSLLTVLASLRQFPLILIDTAGFRLGDPLLKNQLDQLEKSAAIKRVLVVSSNSQFATMKASVHAHRGKRGLHAAILTKVDESASIGEAMSLIIEEELPLAYVSDGQNIPKDIKRASGHGLVSKAVNLAKEQGQVYQGNTAQ